MKHWIAGALLLTLGANRSAVAVTVDEEFEAPAVGAASWLELEGDARSLGLGGAGSSVLGGASSMGANPAGLAGLRSLSVEFSHQSFGEGYGAQRLALGSGWGPGAFGLSFDYVALGSEEVFEFDANDDVVESGTVSPVGMAAAIGYAARWGSLDLGTAFRIVADDPDGLGLASGPGADVGLRWKAPFGLVLGASMNHLGAGLLDTPFPTHARLGLAYSPPWAGIGSLTLALEERLPTLNSEQSTTHVGALLGLGGLLELRGGYEHAAATGAGDWRVGLGAALSGYHLDYAYAAGDEGTHVVTLRMDWAAALGQKAADSTGTRAPTRSPLTAEPGAAGELMDQELQGEEVEVREP